MSTIYKTRADLMAHPAFAHLDVDSEGNPCVWRNHYHAQHKDGDVVTWSSDWSCQCDDDGIEPVASDWLPRCEPCDEAYKLWESLPEATTIPQPAVVQLKPVPPAPTLDIERVLTITTGHVSNDTAAALNDAAARLARGTDPWTSRPKLGVVVYEKGEVGWWIYVPTVAQSETEDDFPTDLRACMELARANLCTWLCLDRDGVTVDGLTEYSW